MQKDDLVYAGHMLDIANKVVHDYMNVDEDVVWDTVVKELPPLVAELEKIVPPEG